MLFYYGLIFAVFWWLNNVDPGNMFYLNITCYFQVHKQNNFFKKTIFSIQSYYQSIKKYEKTWAASPEVTACYSTIIYMDFHICKVFNICKVYHLKHIKWSIIDYEKNETVIIRKLINTSTRYNLVFYWIFLLARFKHSPFLLTWNYARRINISMNAT